MMPFIEPNRLISFPAASGSLEALGYYPDVINVRGDGNCFFYAVDLAGRLANAAPNIALMRKEAQKGDSRASCSNLRLKVNAYLKELVQLQRDLVVSVQDEANPADHPLFSLYDTIRLHIKQRENRAVVVELSDPVIDDDSNGTPTTSTYQLQIRPPIDVNKYIDEITADTVWAQQVIIEAVRKLRPDNPFTVLYWNKKEREGEPIVNSIALSFGEEARTFGVLLANNHYHVAVPRIF